MEIEGMEGLRGTDLIQDTFLFKRLNFEETLSLAGLFQREKRQKGEAIIEEGELGQALYIIENGTVQVLKGEEGALEEIATLDRGELFGEMSLIEDELTSATVVAKAAVEMLVIRKSEFLNLLDQNPEIALKVYKTFCHILSERLRKTSQELSTFKARSHQRASAAGPAKAKSRKPETARTRKSRGNRKK